MQTAVVSLDTQNGSDTALPQCDTHSQEYPYKSANLGAGADVSLSLPALLDMLSCPKVGAAEIECLARTTDHRRELQALVSLWQSLGRPTSPLWRETRVFYNRIVDSY
jgi:hypothetical protein